LKLDTLDGNIYEMRGFLWVVGRKNEQMDSIPENLRKERALAAVNDLTKAIQLLPEQKRIYSFRAFAYKLLGDKDAAIRDLETVLENSTLFDPRVIDGTRRELSELKQK
jgi:hypothetical protein